MDKFIANYCHMKSCYRYNYYIKFALILACVVLFQANGFSLARTTIASGNWNNSAIWSPAGVPSQSDIVIVSHTVTINTSAKCLDLNVNAAGKISYSSGQSIAIYRNLTSAGTWAGVGVLYKYGNGTVTSTSPINAAIYLRFRPVNTTTTISAGTVFTNLASLQVEAMGGTLGSIINCGTLTVSGTLTVDGITTFNNGVNGSLTLTKNVSVINGATFSGTGNPNTVTYTGTGFNQIWGTIYHHLVINNNPSVTTGTKSLTGNTTLGGNLTLAGNMKLNCANFNVSIAGNLVHSGTTAATDIGNAGTFTFNGASQTITRAGGTEILRSVIINPSTSVTLGSHLTCTNLTLSSGTLDVSASNFNLNVSGNIVANALINGQSGTVTLNGALAQTISGSATPVFNNLTSTNAAGISVTGNIALNNILTVSAGAFGTSGAGSITVRANGPTNYGRIANVAGSLTGTGWRVESYINGPATAYWQFLSTPINGNTILDWDSDTRFYMSGVGGNDGTACCPTFFSVRRYNTPTNAYVNITSTGHAITRGRGYLVWMGDNTSQLTAPLVYNSVGLPNFGNVTYGITAGGAAAGANLVGNPYACPIDWTTLQTASGNLGANFTILQENGSYATNPNGGVIAPNQGFMVTATSTGNITFTEACKNTVTMPAIMRNAIPQNQIKVFVNNSINGLGSETTLSLNENGDDLFSSKYDFPFMSNLYETADNIWTLSSDNVQTLFNEMKIEAEGKVVPLTVKAGVAGKHTLTFSGLNNFEAYNCVWVENTKDGMTYDLNNKNTIEFAVPEAGMEMNFVIHMENKQGCSIDKNETALNELELNTQVFNNGSGTVVKFGFSEITPVVITVYNTLGQEVMAPFSANVSAETLSLHLPSTNEIYLINIRSGDKMITRKILN